eukprot:952448-Alexandrium_andersonii.AAC.1
MASTPTGAATTAAATPREGPPAEVGREWPAERRAPPPARTAALLCRLAPCVAAPMMQRRPPELPPRRP